MTVKELREALAELPDDLLVVVSRDAEGNGYSPASGISPGEYDRSDWEFRSHPGDRTRPDDAVAIWPE
jgi:hypothetical protein